MRRAFHSKISQLKSDVRSCRCKHFSLKQAPGMGRGGPHPPDSPPGSDTAPKGLLSCLKSFFSYASCLYLDCELHLNWYVIKGSLGYKESASYNEFQDSHLRNVCSGVPDPEKRRLIPDHPIINFLPISL